MIDYLAIGFIGTREKQHPIIWLLPIDSRYSPRMRLAHLARAGVLSGAFLFSGISHANAADEFGPTCARVLAALRADDWTAFKAQCAEPIIFEGIARLYLQKLPENERRSFTGGPDAWIKDDYVDDDVTQPGTANDRDFIISHTVSPQGKLSEDEVRAFDQFCSYVKESIFSPTVGQNVQGMEVKSLFGPAIEGKVASNFKWRVEMELVHGRWLVRKLIIEEH